ncbi:MAG: apolipoprotein N-acyltransferase [Alistipes sp.]|nr:apolipoprotein N-acyltransferase [Alistipes sp.]
MKNFLLVVAAAVMMAFGWWELTGLVMLGGFVPLLVLASRHDSSRRSLWKMLGWTLLFIALWYGLTIWWVWFATPAGPIAAIFFAWVYTGLPFMLWFFISKRAHKALSYTVLVSAWTVGEWVYNTNQASFPWLSTGNGFAHDVWAVQWYEWTGSFGGTIWVLVTSILIYEFLIVRRPFAVKNLLAPILSVVVPIAVSIALYCKHEEPLPLTRVTIVQPNISAWEENSIPDWAKATNLAELAAEAPADARFIVMPETTVGDMIDEDSISFSHSLVTITNTTKAHSPEATVVVGAATRRNYGHVPKPTHTTYSDPEGWYDIYNSSLAIAPSGRVDIHHKAKMVIGAEMMPTWWWIRGLQSMLDGLGFYAGHYGFGTERTVFKNDGVTAGAGICWESVYGEYTSEFVRNGAQVLFIITNDGWWGNTPGYRQHFDLARLRAIENRRAIARSANTGRSGFIDSRGRVMHGSDDSPLTLGWEERGTLTANIPVDHRMTVFTRLGDWPCRVSLLLLSLSILYFIAYRIRRRNHLVQ